MTYGEAKRECARRNAPRNVQEHRWLSTRADQFWMDCNADGNFVICGGTEEQRTSMLVRKLEDLRRRSGLPVILLTTSRQTVAAVDRASRENRLGRTAVFSTDYPNYHALYQMPDTKLCRLLLALARQRGGENMNQMDSYIQAFVALCGMFYEPCLAALLALDKQYPTNDQIRLLAQEAGLTGDQIKSIAGYPEGRTRIRSVLRDLNECYRGISGPRTGISRCNLLTGVKEGWLTCIDIQTTHPTAMDLALAMELEQLLETRRKFLLIVNDVPLCDAQGIYGKLVKFKNVYSQAKTGICTKNLWAWANSVTGVANGENTLLSQLQQFVYFYDQNESSADMLQQLKPLGEYNKHEVQLSGGHNPGPIHLFHSGNWAVVALGMHPRVEPQDMQNFNVLLKGNRGQTISLYGTIHM